MDLPTILLILAAISIGATVIAVLVALRSAREARTAIFPIVKEEESIRARRARVSILVWLAITAILLGGWLAALQLTNTGESEDASTEASAPAETTLAEFATQSPQETPLPTNPPANASEETGQTAPPTPTPQPQADTPTPVPLIPDSTDTPTPIPATAAPTRIPRGPAPDSASLGPIEFATEISSGPIRAVNPANTFATGIKIYAVYPYGGMENGTTLISVWSLNGTELARDQSPWEWGWQGNSYSFFLPPGAGTYKLELYVNDTLLSTNSFEIQ